MSKGGKRVLLVALCCILGGVVLMTTCIGIAYASDRSLSGEWHYDYDGDYTYNNTGAQRREADSVRSLDFELIGEPISIRRGGDTVVVEWSQDYDQQYDYSVTGSGRLLLKRRERSIDGFVLFGRNGVANARDFLKAMERILRRGRYQYEAEDIGSSRPVTITIPEGMSLDALTIATVSGEITLEDLDIDSVDCAAVDAALRVEACRLGRLDIANVSGSVELKHCELSGVEMGTVSGRLRLTGGRCERIDIGGVNAQLDIDGTEALRDVEIAGVNAMANLRLPGTAEDYDLNADGINAELRINGRTEGRRAYAGRAGAARISADGVNAVLDVQFE